MLNEAETSSSQKEKEAVVIKKYANRRLYNTETSTYVTLEDLANMVRSDRDFNVFDAKTGADLTHTVLTQIIVEQESRGEQTLLPTPFLRQLIRFYDDGLSRMVPGYLQFSLEALAKEQERFRNQFSSSFGNPTAAFDAYQDQARRNMEIFEKAMSLWTPFSNDKGDGTDGNTASPTAQASTGTSQSSAKQRTKEKDSQPSGSDINDLKTQLAAMQAKIEALSQSD